MLYRPLGATGLTVSELGFGCGSVGGLMVRGRPEDQREAVARALDAGITYFDTAQLYGEGRSEENLGRTLRELEAWDRVFVGTKIRLAREDLLDPAAAISKKIREGLDRLGRDSVDLIQLHNQLRVEATGDDYLLPNEALGAATEGLQVAVREGLARHFGITGLGDTAAVKTVVQGHAFETMQCYVNALNPSAAFAGASSGAQDFDGVLAAARAANVGVIAIRTLAAGAASGSAKRATNASPAGGGALTAGGEFGADVERARALQGLADALGISLVELSYRFVLGLEGVSTALVGFSDLAQLEQAIAWQERGPLPPGAVESIVASAR
jgi:aryl-alcohol dehydrogenase-like predicted oxidoreductase